MNKDRILVVDDDPHNLRVIVGYLKEYRDIYQVLQATNGKIACQVAKKVLPDLIIMDWEMPVMNGIEAIKELKNDEQTKNIPVIMATALTASEKLQEALETGAVDYIRKPVEKVELIARIDSILKLSKSYKEIKEINLTKDKLFSIIAHDLKSPFSTIIGFSNLLRSNYYTYSDTERIDFLDLLSKSAERGYNLLDNLLKWGRLQTGRMIYSPVNMKVASVIDINIELLSIPAIKKKINLTSSILDNQDTILADENMLHTIVRNLISNAIKFTHEEGQINVAAVRKNNYIEISVTDSGVGISEENINKLFKIEHNNSTHGTADEIGTGLGLVLCKEFVEKIGGTINVESEINKGSKFFFTVPISSQQLETHNN